MNEKNINNNKKSYTKHGKNNYRFKRQSKSTTNIERKKQEKKFNDET